MPWTPAHPAFAIPFLGFFRRPFTAVCLVISSIAPDLPYFFLVRFVGWGHEFPTSFLFGIPITLIIAFIWARFLRSALFTSLPITSDVSRYPIITRLDLALGCIAAACGIMSHIFIDSFTHIDGYAVSLIPWLNHQWNVFGKTIPLWHLLQYGLSAFGGIVIFYYIFRSPRWHFTKAWRINTRVKSFWLMSAAGACLVELLILLFRWPFSHPTVAIVSAIMAGATGMVITSFIQRDLYHSG
jgi:hypothetical protein